MGNACHRSGKSKKEKSNARSPLNVNESRKVAVRGSITANSSLQTIAEEGQNRHNKSLAGADLSSTASTNGLHGISDPHRSHEVSRQGSGARTDLKAENNGNDSPRFEWIRGDLIGKGAYGNVYQCLNITTGQLLATKQISIKGDKDEVKHELETLHREIRLLSSLSHKNIVKYLRTEESADGKFVDIILEYVPGGSLRSLLEKFGKFDEKIVKVYSRQLLAGLHYLHDKGIIHRDIKCANILVDSEGTIKLSDFGASKRLQSRKRKAHRHHISSKSLKGSPYWMAPEVVRRSGHNHKADIWSVGCTIMEMLTGVPPWTDQAKNAKEVLRLIRDTKTGPTIPPDISIECLDFIRRCLHIDPKMRPNALILSEHPFLSGHPGKKSPSIQDWAQRLEKRIKRSQARVQKEFRDKKTPTKETSLQDRRGSSNSKTDQKPKDLRISPSPTDNARLSTRHATNPQISAPKITIKEMASSPTPNQNTASSANTADRLFRRLNTGGSTTLLAVAGGAMDDHSLTMTEGSQALSLGSDTSSENSPGTDPSPNHKYVNHHARDRSEGKKESTASTATGGWVRTSESLATENTLKIKSHRTKRDIHNTNDVVEAYGTHTSSSTAVVGNAMISKSNERANHKTLITTTTTPAGTVGDHDATTIENNYSSGESHWRTKNHSTHSDSAGEYNGANHPNNRRKSDKCIDRKGVEDLIVFTGNSEDERIEEMQEEDGGDYGIVFKKTKEKSKRLNPQSKSEKVIGTTDGVGVGDSAQIGLDRESPGRIDAKHEGNKPLPRITEVVAFRQETVQLEVIGDA